MSYPPTFMERLKGAFLLSEVIGKRMPLKKHGREFMGLCPFHGEKTPSFTVNNEKGFYHCFGCGAHGDSIEFIKRFDRLTYPESVEKLAREAGIPVPQQSPEAEARIKEQKTLYDVMEAAARWFEMTLAGDNQLHARDYLERRGLSEATKRSFRLGYATDSRDALKRHLLSLNFTEAQGIECGLLIRPDSGTSYDRFRGRVMFPIRNSRGQVIAFGGRLLGAATSNVPKYLNSPETPLFKKGEVLFNLDQAGKFAREKETIVIVEGYMDAISMVQAGLHYTVATLGTAVTPEHLQRLWTYASEPTLCLDGDAAGQRAAQRAAELALPLLKPGFGLRLALLTGGEDPDTYVQKHGRESFEKLLNAAPPLPEALWNHLRETHDPSTTQGLAALEKACGETLKKITDPAVRKLYANDFSGHRKHFSDLLWKQNKTRSNEKPRSPMVVQVAVSDSSGRFDKLLLQIFQILQRFPELAHKAQLDELLSKLEIADPRLLSLRNRLLDALHEDDAAIAAICSELPQDTISSRLQAEDQAAQKLEAVLLACEVGFLQIERENLRENLSENWDEAIVARLKEVEGQINQLEYKYKFSA